VSAYTSRQLRIAGLIVASRHGFTDLPALRRATSAHFTIYGTRFSTATRGAKARETWRMVAMALRDLSVRDAIRAEADRWESRYSAVAS
jgi:hypothetical protein